MHKSGGLRQSLPANVNKIKDPILWNNYHYLNFTRLSGEKLFGDNFAIFYMV